MSLHAFVDKVLTPANKSRFESLLQKGVNFELTTYTVKAKFGSKGYQVSTPIATFTMAKGVSSPQGALAASMVNDFVHKLHEMYANLPLADTPEVKMGEPMTATTQGTSTLGELLKKKIQAQEAVVIPPVFMDPPVMKPVPKSTPKPKVSSFPALKDATTVGQQVLGSSPGSIYECVALNPRVKVACRISTSSLSLRIETNDATPQELSQIKSVVSWKGTYGSIHLNMGSVPPRRVIGALLYGMGVKFDEVWATGAELPAGA